MAQRSNLSDYPPPITSLAPFTLEAADRERIALSAFGRECSDACWKEIVQATNQYTNIQWKKLEPKRTNAKKRYRPQKPQARSREIRNRLVGFTRTAKALRKHITKLKDKDLPDLSRSYVSTREIHEAWFSSEDPIKALQSLYQQKASTGSQELSLDLDAIHRAFFAEAPGDPFSYFVSVLDGIIALSIRMSAELKSRPDQGLDEGRWWNDWARTIHKICEKYGLPRKARNDTNKSKLGRSSPFVKFFYELQSSIPEEFRKHHSSEATLAVTLPPSFIQF